MGEGGVLVGEKFLASKAAGWYLDWDWQVYLG